MPCKKTEISLKNKKQIKLSVMCSKKLTEALIQPLEPIKGQVDCILSSLCMPDVKIGKAATGPEKKNTTYCISYLCLEVHLLSKCSIRMEYN